MNLLKKSLSTLLPAMRISFALVLLSLCVLLSAEMLGFIPQEEKFLLESRGKISESLALQMSVFIPDQDIKKMQKLIRYIVKRNPEILSAGIRRNSGNLIFQSADHGKHWGHYDQTSSTSTHVFIPILQNGRSWGDVELRFEALTGESFLSFFNLSLFRLLLFISLISFFVFLGFMLRTLRQLDPSAVIPERVNAAFDTLAEGVIIIDENEFILLANKSFSEKIEIESTRLIGMKISDLQWKSSSVKKSLINFPWENIVSTGKRYIGAILYYQKSKTDDIKFAINASPIIGPDDKPQGVLITLDDISELEQRNTDLKSTVSQLQKTQFQVQQQNKELSYLATRDPMTGCLNRRSFTEKFEAMFEKASSSGTDLICVMVDIDHFKKVNDNYGHAKGDEVIKMLADILHSNTRTEDLVCRYGGEEFCLVLPDLSVDVAIKMAERIRLKIKTESASRFEGGPRVTASLGISSIDDKPPSSGDLNNLADQALYVAKESGRNQVVRWKADSIKDTTTVQEPASPVIETEKNVAHLKNRIDELEEIATSISAELEYNQSYDKLTGLPNQVLFYDRVLQAIERGSRHDQLAALLTIDIEKFNQINANLGRSVGDQLLLKFSERLNSVFRKTDGVTRLTVSRFSNDEFAVLLTDLQHQDQVTWAVKRLVDSCQEPIEIDGNMIHVSIKVGISLYPSDASSVDELLNCALTAKKFYKQNPTSLHYQFFDKNMQEMSLKQMQLEKELRLAIKQQQWKVLYQPKLDINKGTIIGAEALIRWQHPQRGLLTPFEFIDFAEQRKLIIPIGDWVIDQACKQLQNFISQGINDCKIAVNLSAVQLTQPDLVHKIFSALETYKIPPRLFEIEITETSLIDNIDVVSESLKRLSARGIPIALDDFGTGYSSLNYLKNLPIKCLKIDRSFIVDLCHDKNDAQIVKSLISMAHSLDLTVVAEGVEDKDQWDLLNTYGCDEIQGYLLSKPIEVEEFINILKQPQQFIR